MNINLTTKLAIGDNAFYVQDGGAFCSQVESILLTMNNGELTVNYNLANGACYRENMVYATFAQCEPQVLGTIVQQPEEYELGVWHSWDSATGEYYGPTMNGEYVNDTHVGDVEFGDGRIVTNDLDWVWNDRSSDTARIARFRLTGKKY